MNPILDLRPVRPGVYTYSLRAPGQPGQPGHPCPDFFESIADCLHDAASSLMSYFERVDVRLGGRPAGIYAVHAVAADPDTIAADLPSGR
ncbi:hypothetical protein [Xenophilus sp.]|jgi:hypothetical protein|uniref:hypothetical protein n=1 Tax=Xenophilus sp. TaxID=1873499 RepID=UPI0037DD299D